MVYGPPHTLTTVSFGGEERSPEFPIPADCIHGPPLHSPRVLWGRGAVAGVEVTVVVCHNEGRVDSEEI